MKAKTVTTRCWAEASPSAPAPAVAPTAKPRRLSPFGSISLRETALADVLPFPSRLRRAGAPTAKPRRLLPFGRISLRETARPVIGPTGADVLACLAFALLKRGPPAKTPALLVFNSVFAARKPAGASPRFRTAGR